VTGLSRTPALLLATGAYTAGSVAGAALGGPWWLTALLAALLGAAVLLRDGGARWLVVLAAICAASAGHARIEARDARPAPALAAVRGVHEVIGVVRDDAVTSGTRVRVDLDVESVDGAAAEGGLRLTLPAPRDPIMAGDRLRFTGAVEPPPALDAFDYAAFLRSRDIYVTAAFPASWERLGRVDRGWRGDLADLQRETVTRIERALPEPAAALAAGVLVGERRTMPADITEALRVTGTTHLVVVSGQNVALLMGLVVAAMTAVVSRRVAAIVALVLLPPYVVFVGADPPVVRAAVMAVGVAFASLGGRRTPGWIYLLHAVTVMLALDPTLVRDVAFQLSATATAGVILVAPVLRDAALARWVGLQRPALAAVVETFATATGAALAVLPVQVAAFERVSPWTVPANVAVAPLYEATVAVAALAGALGGFEVAAGVLRDTARFVLAVVQAFARLPAAEVPVRAPLLAGLAFIGVLGLGLRWLTKHTEAPALDPGHRTGLSLTVALGVIAVGLWLAVIRPADDLARITVLDVGQGLAILVQDAGRAVLIDAGPADGALLRALPGAGVRAGLDAVVVTHADLDHTGGMAALLPRLEVGAILGDPAVLTAAGLDGRAIDIGDRVRLSGRVSIEVLAPPVVTRGRAHASSNDASLVLLVTVGERRILLPADIEASAEAWLIESGQSLAADVLVVVEDFVSGETEHRINFDEAVESLLQTFEEEPPVTRREKYDDVATLRQLARRFQAVASRLLYEARKREDKFQLPRRLAG